MAFPSVPGIVLHASEGVFRRSHTPPEDPRAALIPLSTALGRPSRRRPESLRRHPKTIRCSNTCPGYGRPPQIRGLSRVHILGTGKLSRSCPQGVLLKEHQTRSAGCGFVDERSPQTVDDEMIHRVCRKLSTGGPQAGGGCPQRSRASPHRCPLFGNATRLLTVSSERRHTKVPGWAVGNVGEPGDGAGEKWPPPVYRVCRTFPRPQKTPVFHRLHPQGQWTKNRL